MDKSIRDAFIAACAAKDEHVQFQGQRVSLRSLAELIKSDRQRMSGPHFKSFKKKVVGPARSFIPPECTYADAAFYFLEVLKDALIQPENKRARLTAVLDEALQKREEAGDVPLDILREMASEKLQHSDLFIIVLPQADGTKTFEVLKGDRLFRLIFKEEHLTPEEQTDWRARGLIDHEGGIPCATSVFGFRSEAECNAVFPKQVHH